MSALTRKSWKDVRRRWARSLFTIATIAVAVAGLSLFSLMHLLNEAMDRRVVDDRLHDVQVYVQDASLSPAELDQLAALPGVIALDARTAYVTRLREGDRRVDTLLVGVPDFAAQNVDVVHLESGSLPGASEALTDTQNARSGRFKGGAGTSIQVEDDAGRLREVTISGAGNTLEYTVIATEDRAVLYAPQRLVNEIAGASGVNRLDFRLADPAQAQAALAAIQGWFAAHKPGAEFTDLPDVRSVGTWPGKENSENFATLFYVGGILALLSATALVSNTVTTMVAEQRREIAVMKAIGGSRRQIGLSLFRTVWILAAIGTVIGVLLGIPFSSFLASFVGKQFLGVQTQWGYSLPVVIFSIVVGLLGPTLAAIPGLLHATRITVREGFEGALTASQRSAADRLLQRVPLPRTAQVGLRNITRRKVRTVGTTLQVGLAVGVALGFLALGQTVGAVTARTWDVMHWDVIVSQRSTVALDERAVSLIRGVEGAQGGHPVLYNTVEIAGTRYEAWGLPVDTALYEPDIVSGRWFDSTDATAPSVVLGRAIAAKVGLHVGDTVDVGTASGVVPLQVVGLDGRLINNSTSVFIPLAEFQRLLGRDDTNAYWLVSASRENPAIDRLAASAEDTLASGGYPADTEIRYVEKDANLASNRILVSVLAVMGIPIVAIGLIGLVNMMTMNVLERGREIGILRCIGARGRDILRIFQTEALSVALLGWVLSIPAGWLIGWSLVRVIATMFKFGSIPYSFPLWYPVLALPATLFLAYLVVIAPVRRAARVRPGDALRYE
ncbi:MAG: FtsX-like permease family protein [Dehalococcoidia bacterium]|nr:FtsX-like permease family protein [Dehalococcoidia bacterium]